MKRRPRQFGKTILKISLLTTATSVCRSDGTGGGRWMEATYMYCLLKCTKMGRGVRMGWPLVKRGDTEVSDGEKLRVSQLWISGACGR